MAKFKPKAILSRVLLGESRHKEDSLDYLCTGLQRYLFLGLESQRATDNHDDDEDDRSSICSFSTTATADNLPGTGRAVDTYIYQPAGRWIERVAMRFTIASLHPARIVQYIEAGPIICSTCTFSDSMNLHDAIASLCSWNLNGSTVVAGMKGLVKQAQSNSINRSACALAALIRVSLATFRKEMYANVSHIEPIFHLETLAGSLVCSHPEKKWFLLLVKIAREYLIAVRMPLLQKFFDPVMGNEVWQLWPSIESAQKLRQRLIRVLEIYRLSGLDSFEDTLGESCAICAEAKSTWIDWSTRGDAYKHIVETVYLTVIFILRSIRELTVIASVKENRQIFMVLRTIVYWIDAIVYRCIYAGLANDFDMDRQKARIAFRSLVLQVAYTDGDTEPILLPESFAYCRYSQILNMRVLPRGHRGEGTPLIQSLIEAADRRTLRLLRSFDELEREVWGCASRTNISTSQSEKVADPYWFSTGEFGDEWWDFWNSTAKQARRVQVPETILTEEFREAREFGVARYDYFRRGWGFYQLCRGSRHKWGQYLRSNMDWEWDLATCLKRLFKVKKQKRVGPSLTAPASSTTIDVAAGPPGMTLEISIGDAQEESLPAAVKFAYKTKTGETRYMSYVPVGFGPGCQPNSATAGAGPSAGLILNRTDAQQVSGHRKGSFSGEQGVENKETGAFPLDVSQPDVCEETLV